MNDLIFISCNFGKTFKYVHPSPDGKNSFFFTNNPELKDDIIKKGWNYIYVDMELSDDFLISSLQSKYIKFLKFLEDFSEFESANKIIFFDHKEHITPAAVDEIKLLINDNLDKSLIIRQSPGNKNTVYREISEASYQPRYAKNLHITKKFADDMIASGEISENVIICNTGLLIFIDRQNIMELLNNVYEKCIEHEQPECQVYWSIFSQKHQNKIKEIKWEDFKNYNRYDPFENYNQHDPIR